MMRVCTHLTDVSCFPLGRCLDFTYIFAFGMWLWKVGPTDLESWHIVFACPDNLHVDDSHYIFNGTHCFFLNFLASFPCF